MTKDEAVRILLGGKHYDSVEECQSELAEMAEMIEDMEDVVRCRDCKFHAHCRESGAFKVIPPDDWFCADGERKGGEADEHN